jgi:hypothetical protein
MRILKSCWLISPCFAVLLAAAPARAGFVTATLANSYNSALNPSDAVTINMGDGSPANISYNPGKVNWTLNTESGILLPANFITFCLELTQDINPGGQYTYNVTPVASAPTPGSSQTGGINGMGATKANEIALLWGAFYGQIGTDGTKAAAFQLAIWKIEYDWGDSNQANFGKGNFQAQNNSSTIGDPVGLATTWLNDLSNPNNHYTAAQNLEALTSTSAQDQIVQALPVPPSAYLAGIGTLCLLGYGYLRRKPLLLSRIAVPA